MSPRRHEVGGLRAGIGAVAALCVALCAGGTLAAAATTAPTKPPPPAAAASAAITVHDAWARATAPGMTVGAAYLTLQGGNKDDRLVGAKTARAGMVQIHVVTEAGGMARMRETEAVDVPAGQRVALAPQGTHIMLMDLSQPLVAGERFPLTLQFERAGAREVTVQVVAPGDAPPSSR